MNKVNKVTKINKKIFLVIVKKIYYRYYRYQLDQSLERQIAPSPHGRMEGRTDTRWCVTLWLILAFICVKFDQNLSINMGNIKRTRYWDD